MGRKYCQLHAFLYIKKKVLHHGKLMLLALALRREITEKQAGLGSVSMQKSMHIAINLLFAGNLHIPNVSFPHPHSCSFVTEQWCCHSELGKFGRQSDWPLP